MARAIDAARGAEIPVLYVVVGFRTGHPEVSPDNLAFARCAGQPVFTDADPGAEIHPDVAPREGNSWSRRSAASAFAGNDLDMLLRSAGIRHLVLTGISTSGVVLSTLRQAADSRLPAHGARRRVLRPRTRRCTPCSPASCSPPGRGRRRRQLGEGTWPGSA
ncbi:cysteine hydrolase family protein [Yinghuangia aomiensis]